MRILFLTSRFPYPLEKGDKLRAYCQIRELSVRHEIILASVSDCKVEQAHLEALKPYCAKIVVYEISKFHTIFNLFRALFSSWPFQVGYFYSRSFHSRIRSLISEHQPSHIFCQLVRMAEYARTEKGCVRVLDYMDAFSMGYRRLSERLSWVKRLLVRMEWKRLLRYEQEVFHDFDHQLIISEQDRDLIPHPERHTMLVSPNGVDMSYYPSGREQAAAEKKYDLVFSGNMSYPPNVESALFLAHRVLPLLRQRGRECSLVIAGATPAPEISRLKNEGVEVTGWVDDMRPWIASARICVAPMFISIGLQNKIIQAMAMGMPCVVSSLANNAIGAVNGESILLADSPEETADAIERLLDNPAFANRLAQQGQEFVRKNFDWKEIISKLESAIRQKN